ncbi:hypothetical protein GCM10009639_35020 [Kitasatospora putterlickiae]|uniref:LysR substrate-binding domain-containing protein n=1 Tax=Kitasatospora putterlickiae TaxID=221725 RepID=A0ABN1Y8T4_9ACTN
MPKRKRNRPAPVPALLDAPENRALIAHLREQATPPSGPDDLTLGPWQLHTHPDVCDRLRELAPRHPVDNAYGMPVLAFEGVAAVVAAGLGTLLVRLPSLPEGIEPARPRPPLTDGEWRTVNAYPHNCTSAEGTARLTALVREALLHARDLSRNRPRY